MLPIAEPSSPDVLTDSLAGVAAVLHPNAGLGSSSAVLLSARSALLGFLRRFRHHVHENALLVTALHEARPSAFPPVRRLATEHRELRRLVQDLCDDIDEGQVACAHHRARTLLAVLLGHVAHERVLLLDAVQSLDEASTGRFADRLFSRMLRDMGEHQTSPGAQDSIADLHSLYVRLIRHLQGHPAAPRSSEVGHEHSCHR